MNFAQLVLRPPVFKDDAQNRAAALLHYLLIVITFLTALSLVEPQPDVLAVVGNTAKVVFLIGLLVMLHRGRVRTTSLVFCTYIWWVVSYDVIANTGILNPSFSAHVLVILLTGLVINGWATIAVVVVDVVVGYWLMQVAISGAYPVAVGGVTVRMAWLSYSIIFILVAWLTYLGIRLIGDALRQARQNSVALRESEMCYRTLMSNVPVNIMMVDREHRVRFINRMRSGNVEEAIGRPIYDFLTPDMQERVRAALGRVFETGTPEQIEITSPSADEKPMWLSTQITPIRKGDQITEVTLSIVDTTARREVEMALRASEEQYRQLFEGNPHPMFVVDVETGKFVAVNDVMTLKYGYSRDEFAEMTLKDILTPDEWAMALSKRTEFRGDNRVSDVSGPWHYRKKDGSFIQVEITSHRLNYNGRQAMMTATYDVTERVEAETALRASEERFRALTEVAADVVGILNREGDILFISPAIMHITGHTPEELVGNPAAHYVYPDDRPILVELLEKAARNPGEIQSSSFRDQHKNGSLVLVETTARDLSHIPAINGIVFNIRDITERKRAEDALIASEAQYRQLFNANPHPMYVLDLETLKFLDVNDATLDQYGYKRNEFLSMTTRDIRPVQDMGAVVNQVNKFQEQNLTYQVTGPWQHRKKDGAIIQVETAAHRLRYRGRDAVLIAAYDLTERLRAEEGLRRSERLFSTIFHAVPVSILIIRQADGRVVNVNDYLLKLTGYEREQIMGQLATDIPVWGALEEKEAIARSLTETTTVSASEFVWVTHSGQRLSIVSSFLQIDMNGEPCVLGVMVDLTEHERADAARLEAERMQLEIYKEREVVELKEQFISTMSHEFRTPLAIILAAAESLQRYYDRLKPERREEHFYNIKNQVQYVTSMLDEVLTLGKARSGRVRFNPSPIDFVPFCQHLFEQVQMTDTQNHRFIFADDGEIGEIMGDEYLLQHILVNLLSNAIKYSPDESEVRFGMSRANGEVVIHVSDQGIGIPEEDRKYLFDAFFRASNTKTFKGTGLGLAIVKESVEVHGGTISCESVEGKGTTFIVRLPIYPPEERQNPIEVRFSSPI